VQTHSARSASVAAAALRGAARFPSARALDRAQRRFRARLW
jgi:hypothetical protein